MNKKQITIATVLVVLALGATWAMGYFASVDQQVAELESMRDEGFKKLDQMTDEQRRDQFRTYREKERELSDDQRQQLRESGRPMFQQMMNQRMDKFFTMSPEEQTAELDRMIDRMKEWRKNRESSSNDGNSEGARGRGGRGWGGREGSTQDRDQRRKERLDRSTPELRGKMDRFRDMMNERREERGLEPSPGWGGPRGGR